MKRLLKTKYSTKILLLLILLIAAFFRFYGLNWDNNFLLHPDERMILMTANKLSFPKPLSISSLLSKESSLNPNFFAYGSFPIYLLKFSSYVAGEIMNITWLNGFNKLHYIGRFYSALFDLGTVFIIFLLGKKIFSKSTGLS